jgi:hypothetical protein
MKKIVLAAALLVSAFGFSQEREKGDIELAPILGVGFSNYYSGDAGSFNSNITKATFGAQADLYFNDRWSLRSGLMYQVMGTQVFNNEETITYVTLPVNANWHFGSTRKWHLNFGPSFSFMTQAETTIDGQTVDISRQVEPFQIGLSLGIGYKLEINEKFGLSISYNENVGFTNVPRSNNVSFRNSHSAIWLGAVFKLGNANND